MIFIFNFDKIDLEFPGEDDKRTNAISLGDIDDNGIIDLVMMNGHGETNQIIIHTFNHRNSSSYDEVSLPGISSSLSTNAIGVGDFDRDSLLDIVVANEDGPNQLLLQRVDGSFTVKYFPADATIQTRSLVVADLNSDGSLDIIMANCDGPNIVLINDGDADFSTNTIKISGDEDKDDHCTSAIAVGDFDLDRVVDLVVGNSNGPNELHMNNGDGTFEFRELPGGSRVTTSIVVGDLEQSGHLSIVVGNDGQPNQVLTQNNNELIGDDYSYIESSASSLDSAFRVIELPDLTFYQQTRAVAVGDFDGDNRLDIIIGTNANEPDVVLYNKGNLAFEATELPESTDRSTAALSVGDFTGSGV